MITQEDRDKLKWRWTRYDLLLAMLNAGWKVHSLERSFVHQRLKKRMAGGRTIVHCAACSRLLFTDEATLEHIIPLSLGGTYDRWNLASPVANATTSAAIVSTSGSGG